MSKIFIPILLFFILFILIFGIGLIIFTFAILNLLIFAFVLSIIIFGVLSFIFIIFSLPYFLITKKTKVDDFGDYRLEDSKE